MRRLLALACLLGASSLTGCAITGHPPTNGAPTFTPGWTRVRRAAEDAATDPATWAPAAAAGLLQIGHADRNIQHWASDHTPIFGSRANARTASTALLGASIGLYTATTIALHQPGDTAFDTAGHLGVGLGAGLATEGVVTGLKHAVGRTRPDHSDNLSFPSGHAALATVSATMSNANIRRLPLSHTSRLALLGLSDTLSVATGYARVSGNKHYPADVLAGAAIGHFIGVFVDEAFLGYTSGSWMPVVDVSSRGAQVGFSHTF